LWTFPLMILIAFLGVGVGLILGVVNVFVRDVGQVVPILLQILYWFTPIVYPVNALPTRLRELIVYNPMSVIVAAYHDVLVYNLAPHVGQIVPIAVIAVLLLMLGLFVFRRAVPEMVDAL